MKKLLIIALLLLIPCVASAWMLKWDASANAAGYEVYYKPLTAAVPAIEDIGNKTEWTIPETLKGIRAEYWVVAYAAGTPRQRSGDSDHIRWTYPRDYVVVELPEEITITVRIER